MRMILWLACVAACSDGPGLRYPSSRVQAPAAPIALEGVNSPFDDYNASKPPNLRDLIYSTNRGSEGQHLDVWTVQMYWDQTPAAVGTPQPFLAEHMSPADERGPLLVDEQTFGSGSAWSHVLVMASAREGGSGGLDLYWMKTEPGAPIHAFSAVNTAANEAYLTLPYAGRRAMFASDRDGQGYDLYELTRTADPLEASAASIARLDHLSSPADDHAPYVDPEAELLVFASNREGGAGGYDLYCATRSAETWSAPRRLDAFNTASDEFRPTVFTIEKASFLVFSSNRPGGLGGFDLYVTGFDGC